MLIIDYLMEFEGKKQQIKKQYKITLKYSCAYNLNVIGIKLYHFISLSLCCGKNMSARALIPGTHISMAKYMAGWVVGILRVMKIRPFLFPSICCREAISISASKIKSIRTFTLLTS